MELFLNSEEYKTIKAEEEKKVFKLIGKYCFNTGSKIVEKTPAEMNEYYKNKKFKITETEEIKTKNGTTTKTKEYSKNFYQVWSEDPNMKEYTEMTFECDMSIVKPYQYNMFKGFTHFDNITTKKVNLEPVFDHIKSLVDYDEDNFKYVISWLAQLVQKPHILPHTTLIFISEEGVGKDLFSKFISEVINSEYTYNTEKLDDICGKFNSLLGGKLIITLNETNPVESRERTENIKFLITAEDVRIEGKHKDPVKCKNFCRFIWFSNRLFAFPVESGSRRPVIFKASDKYLPSNYGIENNKKYFSNLAENVYKNINYQKAFLEYLKKYDISNWNPKDIKKSSLHEDLEEASMSPIVHYLTEVVKTNPKNFRINVSECYENFKAFISNMNLKYPISRDKFGVEMTNIYKVKKIKNSVMLYEFNIEELKALLIRKFKVVFDNDDEVPQSNSLLDDDEFTPPPINKELEELKKQLELLKAENNKLKQENETLKTIKTSDTDKTKVAVDKKKETYSLDELMTLSNPPKTKTNKSTKITKPIIEDIDDGYDTDELELEFDSVCEKLKGIK